MATLAIAGFGLVLLFLASFIPTVNQIIQDSIDAIGFQASFYYGLACLACAWHVWNSERRSAAHLLLYLLWPLASGLFLWFIAIYSLPTFGTTVNVIAIGGILLGLLPFWLHRGKSQPTAQTQPVNEL